MSPTSPSDIIRAHALRCGLIAQRLYRLGDRSKAGPALCLARYAKERLQLAKDLQAKEQRNASPALARPASP